MKGLGLLGLLVVIAILLLLYSQSLGPVAKTQKEVRPQVEQLAGVDAGGGRVKDSYTLEPVMEGGALRGLRVTRLGPSSAMRSFYGLERGDVIVEAGGQGGVMWNVREADAGLLEAKVAEAYQLKQPLVILRDGQRLTLEGGKKPAAGDTSPSGGATPAGDGGNSVQNQLDKIRGAGGR